jgi:hypothetical protein
VDSLPNANFDLKLTWAYLKSGFVDSPFNRHFPSLPEKIPNDTLPPDVPGKPSKASRKLEDVIQHTMYRLGKKQENHNEQSRADNLSSPFQQEQSADSSMALSDLSQNEVIPSSPASSSGDTMEKRERVERFNRILQEEPWVWLNSLVRRCEGLIVEATQGKLNARLSLNPGGMTLYAERSVSEVS